MRVLAASFLVLIAICGEARAGSEPLWPPPSTPPRGAVGPVFWDPFANCWRAVAGHFRNIVAYTSCAPRTPAKSATRRPASAKGATSASAGANAQHVPRVALKIGETIELHQFYYSYNCQSVMIGVPEIEILAGPVGVTLGIKEEPVVPRAAGCAKKIPGGKVMLTADGIAGKAESKLTYRLNYQTKDGPRQEAHVYIVSLFPR